MEGEQGAPVQETAPQTEPAQEAEQKTFSADYVKALRQEAAAARVELQSAKKAIADLQKGTADTAEVKAKLAELEGKLSATEAAADKAQKEAQLVRLAAKAGVDPDVAALLDLSKLNLADEAAAEATLKKLAGAGRTPGQAKPGAVGNTGMSEAELRDRYWGAGPRTTIFGG